jgi:prepilin-type processing-associated H-X9-DG protein
MQYRLSTIFLVFFFVAASLALFGATGLFIAGVALVFTFVFAQNKNEKRKGPTIVELLVVVSIIMVLIGLLTPAVQSGGRGSSICRSRLGEIGLALKGYHEGRMQFPAVCTRDANGKPLLSWMVEILPYMERGDLYKTLKRDEPWDSPGNKATLSKLCLADFTCRCVNHKDGDCSANFVAVVGPGTIWRESRSVSSVDLPNPSLTVAAVECAESEGHWAAPNFLTVDEALERMKTGKGTRISTVHNGYVHVLFADGQVLSVSHSMPISRWRKLLMGELKGLGELENWKSNSNDLPPVKLWLNEPSPPEPKWPFVLSVVVWLIALGLVFERAWRYRRRMIDQKAAEAAGSLNA